MRCFKTAGSVDSAIPYRLLPLSATVRIRIESRRLLQTWRKTPPADQPRPTHYRSCPTVIPCIVSCSSN